MSDVQPATDAEIDFARDLVADGWPLSPEQALTLLARLDVATARAETAERKLKAAREALRHVAILGHGKCTIGKPLAEMIRAALALIDQTETSDD